MAALEYHEIEPGGSAVSPVRCAWSLRGATADRDAQPIVSDGSVELIFNLSDPFERVTDGVAERQPLAMIVGPTALPTVVRPTGRVEIVGIRLQPWAARSVLKMALHELRDRFLPIEDVLPRSPFCHVSDQLSSLTTARHRMMHLGSMVERVADPLDLIARDLVRLLRRHGVQSSPVRALATLAGRSTRTVERAFREDVGLSPRTLARIERMQRALALSRAEPRLSWVAIGATCGFYDQAHFVHEFRSLVGCTPGTFRSGDESLTALFVEG